MTKREREILKKSVSWTDKSFTVNEEKAFQAGAKWADKTMIEKACKWLNEHIYEYIAVGNTDFGKPYDIHLCGEELFEDLRNAMEE